jgi:hypothetical protein
MRELYETEPTPDEGGDGNGGNGDTEPGGEPAPEEPAPGPTEAGGPVPY